MSFTVQLGQTTSQNGGPMSFPVQLGQTKCAQGLSKLQATDVKLYGAWLQD